LAERDEAREHAGQAAHDANEAREQLQAALAERDSAWAVASSTLAERKVSRASTMPSTTRPALAR
jgi:hypothetical protein